MKERRKGIKKESRKGRKEQKRKRERHKQKTKKKRKHKAGEQKNRGQKQRKDGRIMTRWQNDDEKLPCCFVLFPFLASLCCLRSWLCVP